MILYFIKASLKNVKEIRNDYPKLQKNEKTEAIHIWKIKKQKLQWCALVLEFTCF